MHGVRESHRRFSRYDAAVVAKDVQGERRRTPASGEGSRGRSGDACGDCGTEMDGCGCKRCERVEMQRAPPQESPARISDEGGIVYFSRR